MKSFLQYIVDDIQPDYLEELRHDAFVFPTRRACLIFKRVLIKKFQDKTFWTPATYSIDDFVAKCAGKAPTDELTLIFELYNVYKEIDPKINLEQFITWGQVLINDFDEVDKYLVSSEKIYANLQELGELEQAFGDHEEMRQVIKQFEQVMNVEKTSRLMRTFLDTWVKISELYKKYNVVLEEKRMAYSGLLYRKLAEAIEKGNYEWPFQQINFCGFNALSKAEEVMFDHVINKGLGKVYWDADPSYLNNDLEEAGKFLRRYKSKWPGPNSVWVMSDMQQTRPKISITGTSQSVGQAKITATHVNEIKDPGLGDTAIVLGDEHLLMPVAYAIPETCGPVNITMGFPLFQSNVHNLTLGLLMLQYNSRAGQKGNYYKVADFINIITNPNIINTTEESFPLVEWLKKRRTPWISGDQLAEKIRKEKLQKLVTPFSEAVSWLDQLMDLMIEIHYQLEEGKNALEKEYLFYYLKQLRQLREQLNVSKLKPDAFLLYKLIKEITRHSRLPLEGDPQQDLQVMGLLETRVLDFKNLYILSVNENKLPAGRNKLSYIPFALRKAFKMPTFEEQDAIYAYHFKRLIQRAERVHILYDTEVAVDGSGEKSRFLLQLEQTLKDLNIPYETRNVSKRLQGHKELTIVSVDKTEPVLNSLARFELPNQDPEKPKRLSPTTLVTYIECSLRFYFKHVARLPEVETFSDKIDPREFGEIVHKILEKIYKPFEGKDVNPEQIVEFMEDSFVEQLVTDVYQSMHITGELEGKNLLNKGIIKRLILKVLEGDKKNATFKVHGIETDKLIEEVEIDGRKFLFGGTVDRIDQTGDQVFRIIDYKTGIMDLQSVSKREKRELKEYVGEYFKNSKYKSGFQAYYYAMLFKKKNPDARVKSGIYALKEVNKGVQFLRNNKVLDNEILHEFERQLKELVREIYNPEIPFTETDDRRKCVYCPYRSICKRQ